MNDIVDYIRLQETVERLNTEFYEINGGKIHTLNDVITKTELTIFNTLQDTRDNLNKAYINKVDSDVVHQLEIRVAMLEFCLKELLDNIMEYGENNGADR